MRATDDEQPPLDGRVFRAGVRVLLDRPVSRLRTAGGRLGRCHHLLPWLDPVHHWRVNLLGCIFFGISAVAGYVVPSTGSMLSQAACNWNTTLGAACFLACALDTLRTDEASKMPIRRRLLKLEHQLESDVERVA